MESELEQRVVARTRELQETNEALRHSQQMFARELEIAQRLQHIATELIGARGTQALYQQILDTAMAILQADFASIQKFHPERTTGGELQLLGCRGFNSEAIANWEWTPPTRFTSCGEALRTGRRVAVPDVRHCDFMSGTDDLEDYLGAGILAMQTTPLFSRSGALLGMVSTHWREPHEMSASEFRAMDVLARLAADLIERSLAQDKLSKSEERLKTAERLAHVGHWQWDIRANSVSGSEEMYRIFGKPPDYVPTYEGFLEDLVPPGRERMEQLISDSLARKVGHSVQYQVALRNGDRKTIFCIWELQLDEEGLPVRIFGTCQDVTDSHHAQEESFARQKLESVGTLASGIAHDFNNLLGGVLAQAELALTECAAGRYPEDELNEIRNAATGGSEIVRQLMVYAGRESESAGLVDVSRIVKDTLELLKVSVSKRAVLETRLDGDLPAILANAAQVRQIVMNLATNASDALGDQEGVIRVTIRYVRSGQDSQEGGPADGDHLQLEVCDTGHGIRPEIQAKVFDPFFTTKTAGRGLALAVVHGIVRDLGGTILIESEPDEGARFQVLLPVAKAPSGTTSEIMVGAVSDSFHGITLLVVEDEGYLRQATAKMLRNIGFDVLESADGSSAIELVRKRGGQIDLILLDMTIPGASSQEIVVEAARARPDIRVILTSAYSREMIAGTITAPQIRDFIPLLSKTILNHLSRR